MSALTPGQRSALVRRTRKTVIAAAKRCEAACEAFNEFRHEERWVSASSQRCRAELASIQAFAAIEHMRRQLESK